MWRAPKAGVTVAPPASSHPLFVAVAPTARATSPLIRPRGAYPRGSRRIVAQIPGLADPDMQARLPDPATEDSFLACKLDWSERAENNATVRLHRDLLRMRCDDPVFSAQRDDALDGAGIGPEASDPLLWRERDYRLPSSISALTFAWPRWLRRCWHRLAARRGDSPARAGIRIAAAPA
jgi:hypothetical protein